MAAHIRSQLATSRFARGAAFPLRTVMVARYDASVVARSARWLVRGRETTNITYDLEPLNRDQLCWFVSAVSGSAIEKVRGWVQELEDDDDLSAHVTRQLSTSPRWRISPTEPHWARRFGWYALVRAVEPDHVVETGTHLGLGSCAIAAALRRNGHGRLTTIDVDPEAGHLIGGHWGEVVDRRTGNSIELLGELSDIDLFLHDSLHTYEYEAQELAAVAPNLRPGAIVLSDNAHASSALSDWAERTGRHFLFFKEQPAEHWWPGDGIGAAWVDHAHTRPREAVPALSSQAIEEVE